MPNDATAQPARPTLDGLSFLTVPSPSLDGRGDVTVFVPEQAETLKNAPLVVMLHGAFGSHWNWSVMGGAHRTAQRLMASGEAPPMVLAMPSDGLRGPGTGYVKQRAGDFETWIAREVPEAVREIAPCLSTDSPLFLCGLSMGGFGALHIGAKHEGLCRGVSVHSSVTHFDQMAKYVGVEAESCGVAPEDRCALETLLRARRPPPLRLDCGTEDFLLPHNRKLHADLEHYGVAHRYEEYPGGHDWTYWSAHWRDSLRFFARILAR